MSKLRANDPIFVSFGVLLLAALGSVLGLGLLLLLGMVFPAIYDYGLYVQQLVVELAMLLVMIGTAFLLRMEYVFTRRGKGFLRSLAPGAVILAICVYSGLGSLILSMEAPLQSPGNILCFLLCMAAVGLTEELAFRGLITEMIYKKYGRSPGGVWLTIVVSGLIFGAIHLSNAVGGVIALSGVLIQVVNATVLGMCLGAIYLRGQNLWAVVFIHGFMDFCALLSSGVFDDTTVIDTVSGYSLLNLAGTAVYLVIALVLLRRSKLAELTTEPGSSRSTKVKLAISIALLVAMVAAVVVLSL